MAEKQPIIIIKKKGGGHAAAHGGAWKVAYADFGTAMMVFFLVLWVLGSGEELIDRPSRPMDPSPEEALDAGERTLEVLSKIPPELKLQVKDLKFSIPE